MPAKKERHVLNVSDVSNYASDMAAQFNSDFHDDDDLAGRIGHIHWFGHGNLGRRRTFYCRIV
jgi:hypothetical protein